MKAGLNYKKSIQKELGSKLQALLYFLNANSAKDSGTQLTYMDPIFLKFREFLL